MIEFLATPTPTPSPSESAIAAMPGDVWFTSLQGWLIPLAVAVVGVVGVSVGAVLASGSALRIRLMDMTQRQAETQSAFQIRAVSAVNGVGIALAHAISAQESSFRAVIDGAVAQARADGVQAGRIDLSVQIALDPPVAERVQSTTEAWRTVLAEAHAYTDAVMATAFEDFDAQREVVVLAFNNANDLNGIARATAECEALSSVFGPQIYRVLQVEKAKGSWRMYKLAHEPRIRRLTRQISDAVAAQIKTGEGLIEKSRNAVAEHRAAETGGETD